MTELSVAKWITVISDQGPYNLVSCTAPRQFLHIPPPLDTWIPAQLLDMGRCRRLSHGAPRVQEGNEELKDVL